MESESGKTGGAKVSKKDRHMKCLHELSKFLENVNEQTVQKVLLLTRVNRETLEDLDIKLQQFCKSIDVDTFLLDKLEPDLLVLLEELKGKILDRERLLDKFAADLDQTEIDRAAIVGKEFKTNVDKLIAIAHQLPDDIERLIETEAYEVNKEVIKNRLIHAETVANLRVVHVQLEYELIEKWENTRKKWRLLRHNQALDIFRGDIRSDFYNDPEPRKNYLTRYRDGQRQRRNDISNYLNLFKNLQYDNITVDLVTDIQQKLTKCNEIEIESIQECYNRLSQLQQDNDYLLKERIEKIRSELHVYGAMKVDPNLKQLANELEKHLQNPELAELFRLGGGIKQDFTTIISELRCDEIIYDRIIISLFEKLELLICGFNIKGIMVDKGRLSQLEKIRGLITKMRNAPRNEIAEILQNLMNELTDILTFDNLTNLFKSSNEGIIKEMKEELVNLEKRIQLNNIAMEEANSQTLKGTLKTSNATLKQTLNTKTSKTKKIEKVEPIMTYVDPTLVKNWYKKLGVLFFSSDFSEILQNLLLQILSETKLQQECNIIIDEIVYNESDNLLNKINNRSLKLINKIISYLENSNNIIFIQNNNLCEFYFNLARRLEKHRADQKAIDNKSADELWDISEEFRLNLEDLENNYQSFCQKIREATKQEQINEYFQEVLNVLNQIQALYRKFHSNSCFASDCYLIYLINEFRNFIYEITLKLFMLPTPEHMIFFEYNRLFDLIERLNASYFENKNSENFNENLIRKSIENELNEAKGEIFNSPLNKQNNLSNESIAAFYGNYRLLDNLQLFYDKFLIENCLKEIKEENVEEETKIVSNASIYTPHSQCCFMKSDSKILPKTIEDMEKLDGEDLEDYKLALVKGFVALPEGPQDPSKPVNPFPVYESLAPPEQEKYNFIKNIVNETKEKITTESTSDYIRAHIPIDNANQPWVMTMEITNDEIFSLYDFMRTNIITNFEFESFRKIKSVERDMNQRKQEFTDQLEERIRNHWPRRGRVETEIKQPREAELLGHKDKTYRMIKQIQAKSIELQTKYENYLQESKQACDNYIQNMTNLRNSLNGDFKNLAALQGIDVKARNTTIEFQADCSKRVVNLQKFVTNDVETIVVNARDFRKVCPLQTPGVQGGYSESELQEIEVLIESQVKEIYEVNETWKANITQLGEQQTQSLKCQDEFSMKYNKCVQEVAMAEGLGQKYGAPRRRAQERIRSEVARDERNAGKIDEFIAQIEFICDENILQNQLQSNTITNPETIEGNVANAIVPINGKESLRRLNFVWLLLKTLREALGKRVAFLKVQGDQGVPAAIDSFGWVDEARMKTLIYDLESEPNPFVEKIPGTEEVVIPGQIAQLATIEAVFEDVNTICRKETKQLYESEGLGSALGPTGVPDSLEQWLKEAKEKLLGRHGYRERAWKKLWAQLERLDALFARFRNLSKNEGGKKDAEDGHEEMAETKAPATMTLTVSGKDNKISIQTSCIHYFVEACIDFSRVNWQSTLVPFQQLLDLWEQGRDKHERLLRPRLGSPDKIDELNELNDIEMKRSKEMIDNIVQFRTSLIRSQVERFRCFCVDLSNICKSLLLMLDGIYRQELLAIPPDTEIPKKHMTLKKLRKAQRIREEVARGGQDRSQRRTWPGLTMPDTVQLLRSNEDLVDNLGKDPNDTTGGLSEAPPAAAAPTDKKGAPAKKDPKKPDKGAEGAPTNSPPSLLPNAWLERIEQLSAVEALVSSAHRIIIEDRSVAVRKYATYLEEFFSDIREDYDTMLKQERSWQERWQRQVAMLRQGNI